MNKPKHIKKRKHTVGSRVVKLLVGAAALYLVVQAVQMLLGGTEVVSATRISVDDMRTATGYFLRDETVVKGPTSNTVEHIVHNGEKVRKGTQLAVEFSSASALNASHNARALADQISLLQSVANAAAGSSDSAKLDQLITVQMEQASAKTQQGDLSDLEDASTQLRQLILRRGAGSQNLSALQSKISALQTREQTLQQSAGSRTTAIESPSDGYFCDTVDGYEGILKASGVEDLTVETLQKETASSVQTNTQALGKIMNGFTWYFAAVLPQQETSGLKAGQAVSLRFSQLPEDIPATVYAVRPGAGSDGTLLVFQSNYITSELLSMRKQTVGIVLGSYTGIKIPKSAMHMQDGEMGVYTLSGDVSHFKPVKILYEGSSYYVVEQSTPEENGIVLQDKIIVHAHGLEDNKVMKT